METRLPIGRHTLVDFARQQLERTAEISRSQGAHREIHMPFLQLNAWFGDAKAAEMCRAGLAAARHDEARTKPVGDRHRTIEIIAIEKEQAPACWMSDSDFGNLLGEAGLRGSYMHDYRFWQIFDPAAGVGVQISDRGFGYPPWEPGSPLRAFLHWTYDDMKMRLTHAATLGSNGRGFLLAGRGGSGKSGTTLAGILHGLSSVGDDYVLVEGDRAIRAHAIFSQMKQDPAGLRRNRVDTDRIGGKVNWQGKIVFDPRSLHAQAFTHQLEIVGILLPRVALQRRTTMERAKPAEAMLSLAPSGVFQMPSCGENGARFFARLARELPAWHLRLSEEGSEIADAIHDFLEYKEVARAG